MRAADRQLVARDAKPALLCGGVQARTIRNDDVDAREAFAATIGRLDEPHARIVERHLEAAACVLANRHAYYLAPSLGQARWIGRLQLDGRVCADNFSALGFAPAAAAGRLPVALSLALRVPIDLEE